MTYGLKEYVEWARALMAVDEDGDGIDLNHEASSPILDAVELVRELADVVIEGDPDIRPNGWVSDGDGGSKPVYRCGVGVCDSLQDIGPNCVCEKCSDVAYSHGDGGFNEEGDRLCDCSDCEKPAIGVFPGEGSASWLCEEHEGEWF